MRLPRFRFTIGRLMLVVSLAGSLMGGCVWGSRMWRLSDAYADIAQISRSSEGLHRKLQAAQVRASHEILFLRRTPSSKRTGA
jgi:hypothetical protein